jgi:hypothetical protein
LVGDADIEHVLRKLMERIAAWRGSAHSQFEWTGRDGREHRLDLHQMVSGFREGETVRNRRLREGVWLDEKDQQKRKDGVPASHGRC